ncbi:hypothetical protein [Candidatus Enterococcus ikei]|uniref:Uncharacterized protein n=1 Tax=Candidatus Enterococcus ikei TaxID=2815326 RepID=A0ABS3GUR7_9ENTE|nr:hypothetical protein [Enterococcus sp. DIV0869a]MBO0439003.1 hypothetical protein [Enterococcus sp. DIV0869a]
MKIFKPKKSNSSTDLVEALEQLLENDLPLDEKILNLINSFEDITLKIGKKEQLIKLLLNKLNYDINFSRVGDNNERYDAIIKLIDSDKTVLVEIEIPSTAMLDAPRNLLDDVAVYCNRYDTTINNIIPVVFCWAYPNNRTDYWNVVNDISKVIDIRINTISVVALACYYWTGLPFDISSSDFYLDTTNNKLDTLTTSLKKKNVNIQILSGFLSPIK